MSASNPAEDFADEENSFGAWTTDRRRPASCSVYGSLATKDGFALLGERLSSKFSSSKGRS
jgi:hypothetical protein